MTIWKRLFGMRRGTDAWHASPFGWIQLPPISAIALLDADAFSRAPAILHGLVGLRDILVETAREAFPDDSQDELVELTARKCQFLAVAETNAGLTVDRLGSAAKSFCSDQGFDLVDSDSGGRGVAGLYAAAFPEAWAEWHVIADANLSKDHWRCLFACIPKAIDAPARLALGRSEEG